MHPKNPKQKKISFVFCSCCCCCLFLLTRMTSACLFLRTFFAASLIGRWNTVLKSSMDWTFCTVTCVRFWIDRELHYFATSSLVHREEDTRQNCGKIQRFVSISSRYGHNVMVAITLWLTRFFLLKSGQKKIILKTAVNVERTTMRIETYRHVNINTRRIDVWCENRRLWLYQRRRAKHSYRYNWNLSMTLVCCEDCEDENEVCVFWGRKPKRGDFYVLYFVWVCPKKYSKTASLSLSLKRAQNTRRNAHLIRNRNTRRR